MNTPLKIVLAIATLLVNLFLIYLIVWSLITGVKVLLTVVCILLLVAFGYFSYRDFRDFFITKKYKFNSENPVSEDKPEENK